MRKIIAISRCHSIGGGIMKKCRIKRNEVEPYQEQPRFEKAQTT